MSVELIVSAELLDEVGPERFAAHLKLFDATVISSRPADYGIRVVYTLDVPDAPEGAVSVTPIFQNSYGTVSVHSLDWRDAYGRTIQPKPPKPTP